MGGGGPCQAAHGHQNSGLRQGTCDQELAIQLGDLTLLLL